MTITADQTGLSKEKLKAGDQVTVIKQVANMCLVEKDGTRHWINEKYLKL